jgi:hypothetical protein
VKYRSKRQGIAMKFLNQLTKVVNTSQARSVILTGNIYDLFFDGKRYVPLMDFLKAKLKLDPTDTQKGLIQVVYQLNRPIEFVNEASESEVELNWKKFHPDGISLSQRMKQSNENATYAFELLRQMTECSRKSSSKNNLLVLVEAADMLLPECEVSRMSLSDRRRIGIVFDWLGDPDFMEGHDTVIFLADSRSNIHHKISRLPNVLSIDIPLPDLSERSLFIESFSAATKLVINKEKMAEQTAGLSLHAIRQLLCSGDFSAENIAIKVEEYMTSQLGEGVVEFKRPTHTMESVVGNSLVKKFLTNELIPSFKASGKEAISGAAVSGPIGGGKTYICEAVASELGIPVIVLKNIRSKWFGETDQIFERLRRLLESFYKIVIFVDEADTMFGDIQSEHDTEKRLTGKIQAMMSDPLLKGRVIWFLMTARIHRLSPDIRRPGRIDLILPILDPEGEDRAEFINWTLSSLPEEERHKVERSSTQNYSAASFSLLKNEIEKKRLTTIQEVMDLVDDLVLPDIEETREYQTLQAKVNCTRKSLLVDKKIPYDDFKEMRKAWKERLSELERMGIN